MFQISEHIHGEHNRLVVLYNRYAHSLWYIAKSYVKDEHIAEDMVQDVFVKLMKNPEILERVPEHKERAFLTTMVGNRCIDFLRKKKRKSEEAYGDYMDSDSVSIETLPLERLVQNETIDDICRILGELPESFRVPLEMHMLHDLSNQEIADLLNITKNLVAVRLNRGRNRILKALKEE